MSIRELMNVPDERRDIAWLKRSLQHAVELEFSTIPPYLCGMWSIEEQGGPVRQLLKSIVLQEMLHMGLACNMLTTVGGTPEINTVRAVPKYPGSLPGGVRPQVRVTLTGLSRDVVADTYMEIEYPENGPIALFRGEIFPTIGAFYSALMDAFRKVPSSQITGDRQLTEDIAIGLFKIRDLGDVERAVKVIKEQGEGTSQSPFSSDLGGELAHYYKFAQLYHGRELVRTPSGAWQYTGSPIPFPQVLPMAEVPSGGYPESRAFDQLYTDILDDLQTAWERGEQVVLERAMANMFNLEEPARTLMTTPLPQGGGNYGPSFILINRY